jgi:hypothetical protein
LEILSQGHGRAILTTFWNIKLPLGIHAEDSVEAGLIKVDESCGLGGRMPQSIVGVAGSVVMGAAVALNMLLEFPSDGVCVIPNAFIGRDEKGIRI